VVRCSNTRRPSNTCAIPRRTIACGAIPSMRWPLSSMVPLVTSPRSDRKTPEIAFSVVVFPAPFAPSSVVMCPSATVSETPFSTRMTPS